VHHLGIDLKKVYDLVTREVLYNILIEFGVPMKLARKIKLWLIETYGRIRIGKHLSDLFPIKYGLQQGDTLPPLFFNFALKYAIRRFQVNQHSLKLNSAYRFLVYADNVNILGSSVLNVEKNIETLVAASMETGLEVIADKTKTWSCVENKMQDDVTI
jgi:hypothetical protein